MATKTQTIKNFLKLKTHADLAEMYDYSMECQVNVAQGLGDRVDTEYNGRRTYYYTDGVQEWKNFRIPFKAASNPEYEDREMSFDLMVHAEAVGMTGWDWVNLCSRWVAFDFDAILGHSDKHASKLTNEQLSKVREAAISIPWITVRNSTSGKGLHLYVYLNDVPTTNHTEHAALARAILAKMNVDAGFDFANALDVCGSNMWIWHRKMIGTDGLRMIKEGDVLTDIPVNWRDHLEVINGKRKKVAAPIDGTVEQKFDVLTGQRNRVPLDKEHLALIKFLGDNGHYYWWDADHHMLVTHTLGLKAAHKELTIRGIFETDSKGTSSHNCFLFPMRMGAWSVRRYSPGCKEHLSWDQDGAGWTRCFFNNDPTLRSASFAYGGLEDPSGGFSFVRADQAASAALNLGANLKLPPEALGRPAMLKTHKDGRLVVEFDHHQTDSPTSLPGWLKKGSKWIKMFTIQRSSASEIDVESFDDTTRHLTTSQGEDSGWVIKADGTWIQEPLTHVKLALKSMGLSTKEVDNVVGGSVLKPWTLVQQPFKSEYPGDRIWNRNAPQFLFPPSMSDTLDYPTWNHVLDHIGKSLTPALEQDPWAISNGVKTGTDYLKLWIASMFQFPFEHLPYLFIYGEKQCTGKSSLHEALSLLFRPGCQRADHALQNPSTFNAELEGAILCIVEETDLSGKNTQAYTRIKDWVTSPMLSIHCKQQTPYMVPNSTHWMQMSNARAACPVFPGDERIVYIYVDTLVKEIAKNELMRQLAKEGPEFLAAMLALEVPPTQSRLRIPVIRTSDKTNAEDNQRNALETFLKDKCFNIPGAMVSLGEFHETFLAYCDPQERLNWTSKQSVSKHMPSKYPKGRQSGNSQWYWGNISLDSETIKGMELVCVGEKLVPRSN